MNVPIWPPVMIVRMPVAGFILPHPALGTGGRASPKSASPIGFASRDASATLASFALDPPAPPPPPAEPPLPVVALLLVIAAVLEVVGPAVLDVDPPAPVDPVAVVPAPPVGDPD